MKKSTVSNAGMGLFAGKDFAANALITYYKGEILTRRQLDERYGRDETAEYVIKLKPNVYIDARSTQSGVGRWANTCDVPKRAPRPCDNNAIFLSNLQNSRVELHACNKPIKKGDEIFASYMGNYRIGGRLAESRPCKSSLVSRKKRKRKRN